MDYEFSELTDMIMCYGEARGNERVARHIYEQCYPNRRHPHHSTFAAIHQRLREMENLHPQHVGCGRRDVRTPEFEDDVVERFSQAPSTSTCAVAHAMGISHLSIWRVLQEYHLQKVQALGPCMQSVRWFLHRSANVAASLTHVLFTDEAYFMRDYENSRVIAVQNHQQRFSVNMWTGIVGIQGSSQKGGLGDKSSKIK